MAVDIGKKILYFINGTYPTAKEQSEALALGTKMFRNAQYGQNESPEKCDAVAGAVPEAYQGFPRAKFPEAPAPTQSTPNPTPVPTADGQPPAPNPWKKE